MFRTLLSKSGVTLKSSTAIVNGESSSSSSLAPTAKYLLRTQNPNVKSKATFSSLSTTNTRNATSSSSDSNSFVVSYLVKSCGLTQHQATAASKQVNFKTKTKPDSVLTLLRSYGFTEHHISKLINEVPCVIQSNPSETLQPKLDFFISKGLPETDLANVISSFPGLLTRGLHKQLIPSFDLLKSVVQSDENVITMIRRNSWIISLEEVKKVMVNVEHLRNEGVPETNICKHLIEHIRAYTADKFEEIVRNVKEMGFDHSETRFLKAVGILASVTKVKWRKKMDIYTRFGWSEDQIQSAFRKSPECMTASENKIMEILNFLVNEMGYDSSIVAENPIIFTCGLQGRIIPRCYVIRVLVSRGLIKEDISLSTLATLVDESFLEKFVKKFEQEVPGLLKVFERQLNYQELLQK